MRILVTGGAGFIGSHVVEAYAKAGHEVAVVDDYSTGTVKNLLSTVTSGNVTILEADICDGSRVADIFDEIQPEVVNHHAARVDVAWCEQHRQEVRRVNVAATAFLVAEAQRIHAKRFIFASSAGAYGECDAPAMEGWALHSLGVYTRSKSEAERRVSETAGTNLTRIILRYANVYGPRATAGVIPAFTRSLIEERRPTIYGDGQQIRDFVHVRDVARANLLALDHPEVLDGSLRIYNIASGHPISVNRLWAMVSAEYAPARPAEVLMSRIDASLAAEELAFEPTESLQAGLSDLLRAAVN